MRPRVLLAIGLLALTTLAALCVAAEKSDTPAQAPSTQPTTPAATAFERFKAMEGSWEGKSTKGWTERLTISVIAGGSAVLEQSEMLHGPDEEAMKMATVYHMDGPQLMLTHYCAAKNQPRLRATEISNDGSDVLFTFLDATNLPTRDAGHMDKVHVKFASPDRVTQQWTFYAKGKEQWMEQIEYRRVKN
jgi:hypothetical protein